MVIKLITVKSEMIRPQAIVFSLHGY